MATVSEEPIKKHTLLLDSLEIRAFRGFQHLKIEHLGRVNLIVGKNNVGKTALLEALRLYASRGSPEVIWDLLGVRGESVQSSQSVIRRFLNLEDELLPLKYLFYGHKDIKTHLAPIQIGPIDSLSDRVSVSINWHKTNRANKSNPPKAQFLEPEEDDVFDSPAPYFTIQIGERDKSSYPIHASVSTRFFKQDLQEINCIFRSSNGLDRRQVGELWDSIALTELEKEILAALRIIAPGVVGLNLVIDRTITSQERIPIVKVTGIDKPLPLNNLGDGMLRMLGIALALVNAKDGMLLVDEIENGLHYSVLPDLWRMIVQLARRLNVQVFATTHSWDCIEGFQQAAQEDTETEGMLIRLDAKKDGIAATLFDERRLAVATREQIEVR